MALCYIASSSNGTRHNIWGIYPTYEEAFNCLKEIWEYSKKPGDIAEPTTLEEIGADAMITEIPDAGKKIYIEIHEW